MSQTSTELSAIYIDGETKTGKGSASEAIAAALKEQGLKVYYDVAGDFYRRYTALVRLDLGLGEGDALPAGDALQEVAQAVYDRQKLFEPNDTLGDLQRPAISKYVSILGELPLAQKAGKEWWAMTLQQAHAGNFEVLVVDGRNPRIRMQEAVEKTGLPAIAALDLYMTCEPDEAARRTLLAAGVSSPTPEQIAEDSAHVADRRNRDRTRADTPFIVPDISVQFDPESMSADEVLDLAWQKHDDAELPITITLDNTHVSKPTMLAAVSELAVGSLKLR